MLAATRRADTADRDTVDEFWRCKDMVYGHIINSRGRACWPTPCARTPCAAPSGASPAPITSSTERRLFAKLPELRALLTGRDFEREAPRAL